MIVPPLFDAEQVCGGFFSAFHRGQLPTEARDSSNKKVNENIKVLDRSMEQMAENGGATVAERLQQALVWFHRSLMNVTARHDDHP